MARPYLGKDRVIVEELIRRGGWKDLNAPDDVWVAAYRIALTAISQMIGISMAKDGAELVYDAGKDDSAA